MWRNDLPLPVKVPRDSGTSCVDLNGHRFPSYPLLPLFVAADIMESEGQSKVQWDTVDVVTDRNNLRKLLSFVEDSDENDFRIDIDLVGAWTMLLQRWEERTIESSEMRGYNESFCNTSTVAALGCEKSSIAGYHRVVTSVGCLSIIWLCSTLMLSP